LLLKTIAICLLIGLAGPAWCDQIVLKNGDRVTGKIVRKDGGKLTIKSELMGDVTVPWDAVTGVTTDDPINVVMPDGKLLAGKLSTRDGAVEIATPAARQEVPLASLGTLRNAGEQKAHERLENPRLTDLWAGSVDLGFALARGNSRTNTFTTGFNTSRVTRTDKATLYFNSIYATARSTQSGLNDKFAQAVRGGWAYNKSVNPRFFFNMFNDYEYDRFQNLDLRFVLGGGFGYNAVKKENQRLDLLGGLSYNREKFSTPLTRNSAEAYWGDDWTYKLSSACSLRQGFRMFNNLSTTGEYRVNFDLGVVTTIRRWLAWQVTASDRFLSNPVGGRQRNDMLLTTGLRISFAR
jgi:putative salt-induced outer membrane protein YdiY